MPTNSPRECPECGSTDISERNGECECESCGLRFDNSTEESDSAPEWQAFEEDISDANDEKISFEGRVEERRQQRAEREKAQEESVEQREAVSELPQSWENSFGPLLTCQDGVAYLYGKDKIGAIEANTGSNLWETKVENLVSPSSVDLLASSNVRSRVDIGPKTTIIQTRESDVVGIDTTTGEHLWRRSLTEAFDGKMSADEERVYIAGELGQLQTLDIETGETLWSVTDSYPESDWQSWFPTPPLVTDDLVISTVNTHDGWILAREKQTGTDRWQFALRETPAPTIKATEDRLLAPTVTGDVFALNLADGTQDWRYRLPEYGDREEPNERTRPRTAVEAIASPGSYHLITGQGFYAGLINQLNGKEVLELSSIGDGITSNPEATFDRQPLVFDDGSITVTFAGRVARAYDFTGEVENEGSARQWHFQAQDRSRVEPIAVNERHMAIPDRKETVCLLEVRENEPSAYLDLETSVDTLDTTERQLIVEAGDSVVAFDCSELE